MTLTIPLQRMISGGQTGVDRAALDAALDAGFPCGGWCPKGRRAEDGRIPRRYPLIELPEPGYLPRTQKNIEASDATLILTFGPPEGGTATTGDYADTIGRPRLVIDAQTTDRADARSRVGVRSCAQLPNIGQHLFIASNRDGGGSA